MVVGSLCTTPKPIPLSNSPVPWHHNSVLQARYQRATMMQDASTGVTGMMRAKAATARPGFLLSGRYTGEPIS